MTVMIDPSKLDPAIVWVSGAVYCLTVYLVVKGLLTGSREQ